MDACEAVARQLAERQRWLLTAPQTRAAGMTPYDLKRLVRRGEWLPVRHGVYLVDADCYADGLDELTGWFAVSLAEGSAVCFVAGTGARVFGMQGLIGPERIIEVAKIGGGSRHHLSAVGLPGSDATIHAPDWLRSREWLPPVVFRQLPVAAEEVVRVDGLPVRRADLTVVDAAIDSDRPTALSLLDSALHLKLVSEDDVAAALAAAKGRPGIQQLRPLAGHADGRAASTVESRVRLCCIDGGLAPDDLQYEVSDGDANLLAIGDMAWLKRRRPLLGEADGESVHSLPQPVFRDRSRGNALVGQAYDTVRFTYRDSRRPRYVQFVVRQALAAD